MSVLRRTAAVMRIDFRASSFLLPVLFAGLAGVLLVLTMAWHIPFMLWDHLDFALIYVGWQNGALLQTIFLHIHGGHFHTAAYAVLLATTWLSHGQTWLDCCVSWLLLCLYALLLCAICKNTLRLDDGKTRMAAALIVFLALYPGHLPNLQWGWQVAVFLCLVGVLVAIYRLSGQELDGGANLIALLGATLAFLSFGTALVLVPIALLAIAVRHELSIGKRIGYATPWLICGLAAAYATRSAVGLLTRYKNASMAEMAAQLWLVVHYALNYLGSGLAHFSTASAPWLALFAIFGAVAATYVLKDRRAAWPWIGLVLFGLLSALLTALGRADEGDSQAFVGRYVSFSSVFWTGCVGLIALALQTAQKKPLAWVPLWLVAGCALINAVSMAKEARQVGEGARAQAATLCATYPNIDRATLEGMHYAGADAARERLQVVHTLRFPPFDDCALVERVTR